MSGTSVDAVDVAITRVHGGGETARVELLHFTETLYSEELQNRIFANSEITSSNVNDICLLHSTLAHVYAAAVRACAREAGMEVSEIDLVGMHGQTLRHLPGQVNIGGQQVRSTLQIGSGPTLATLLQVPVVYDFRSGDIALGGQGAPLVPYADAVLFRSRDEHRVLLNIGGIANCTVLPRACALADVTAVDTGPGNMIVDALMRKFYGREFDERGMIASSGTVQPDLLSWLFQHPYYREKAPKSAGREMFGEDYVEDFLNMAHELGVREPADLVATASEITVRSIAAHIQAYAAEWHDFHLLISGGGARNRFFVDGLRYALSNARIDDSSVVGVHPDAKEALVFSLLANEWLMGNPANLPAVTGAERPGLLGALALPS
jgi:anhydro-N-acetylmuramic acid kinase